MQEAWLSIKTNDIHVKLCWQKQHLTVFSYGSLETICRPQSSNTSQSRSADKASLLSEEDNIL